jgi:hypothetical protein
MNRPHLARRRMAAASLGGLALLALPALAQVYPARPIRIVVPWPAGGLVDLAARTARARGCRRRWASRWWSTTGSAPAATSAPTWWPRRRPTATRWCSPAVR